MSSGVPITIRDSKSRQGVRVVAESLQVIVKEQPALDSGTPTRQQLFTGLLGSTGIDSGITNQNVNGSVTPQVFYLDSSEDYDIHVQEIQVLIAASTVRHQYFGDITALTNGVDIIHKQSSQDVFIINKAKTGGQVIAQSFNSPIAGGAESFELINWSATGDAQLVNIPIYRWFPSGLRIGRGTTDQLRSVVNDNLSSLEEYTVRIMGYKNVPV